jgi:hypothetical protein
MLRESYKNLRWEEAHFIYCHRHSMDLSFDDFMDNFLMEIPKIDDVEFETICKDIRRLDIKLRSGETFELSDEELLVLNKFGK